MQTTLRQGDPPGSATTLLVLATGARGLPVDLAGEDGTDVILAGPSRTALALAQMSLPGAEIIRTDLNNSASLRSLQCTVRSQGGVGRLVIVGGPEGGPHGSPHGGAAGFAELAALLNLMPALCRTAEVVLCPGTAASGHSLRTFVEGVAARLPDSGLVVRFNQPDRRTAAG